MLSESYVLLLARLITAAEQENDSLLTNGVVDTIALTDVDTEFTYTASDGSVVSEISFFNAIDTNENLRLYPSIP